MGVYRNGRASAATLVFAGVVVILVISSALSGHSTGLRAFGIVVAVAIAAYAVRVAGVEVRVSADGVRVRNAFSTRRLRWSEISDVRASPAFSPRGSRSAFNVVFVRTDGGIVRAQALRKSRENATSLASDLAAIASQRSAGPL